MRKDPYLSNEQFIHVKYLFMSCFKVLGKQKKFLWLILTSLTIYVVISICFLLHHGKHCCKFSSQEERNKMRSNKKPIRLLYWSKVFREPVEINNTKKFPFFRVNEGCEQRCELTTDKSLVGSADAIIIHARDPNPFPAEKYFHIPFILHSSENPVYSNMLSNPLFLSYFTYSMTYRLDSDFPSLTYTKPLLTEPVPFKEKKLVFAAFSNCERARTMYFSKLMKLIPIDSFGACLKNKNGLLGRYKNYFKEDKVTVSRGYKFTLVFMNADCEYFVDDQLSHAFSAGSVPVFMGTDKVDEFLPGNLKTAVIKVKNFRTPKDLAKYLLFLSANEHEYNKYLKWKTEGLQLPSNFHSSLLGKVWSSPDTAYCKICKTLANEDNRKRTGLKLDDCKPRRLETWLNTAPIDDKYHRH